MIEAHPGVEIGDHQPVGPGGLGPRSRGVDRGGLGVLQVPLLTEQRVIGRRQRVPPRVDFGVLDSGIGAQPRKGLRRALPGTGRGAQQVYA